MESKLKDIYSIDFLTKFSQHVQSIEDSFLAERFVASVLANDWQDLSVRERAKKIAKVLGEYLPSAYKEAIAILLRVVEGLDGFVYLFFPDFVAYYGLADWELSMRALERFTQSSSAEFAIRPFLIQEPERTLQQMMIWTQSENEHIRRLASEGCRPRLPWAEQLIQFRQDPTPVFSILDKLKADDSLYVRKSVANNLNDISKDHPDLVLKTVASWWNQDEKTDWIIRRGCRTLIKEANPEAMKVFGYVLSSTAIQSASITSSISHVKLGETCEFSFRVEIEQEQASRIRLEYGIEFIKANGKANRKKFFIRDTIKSGHIVLEGKKSHTFKELTTRRHYAGRHRISLLVNGVEVAAIGIELEREE